MPESSTLPAEPRIYQVSQLVMEIRQLLEASYRSCWVEAEVSSLSRPASGHCYFSLKDDSAQIRCAMFKAAVSAAQQKSGYTFKEGDLIRARGKVSVYTARGDMQFIVQHVEPAGEGALKRQFEQLKQTLADEGLFDQQHKQVIPKLPQCIGLISSATGAAINDILTTLNRRFPSIPVRLYPSLVQGEQAPGQLIKALRLAEKDQQCDVLILSRGGGSLEDLWAFNDEKLARAIFACPIPIVSAVGHEVDVSISDFVADIRAATPTAAAELVTPDQQQYQHQLHGLLQRLNNSQRRCIQDNAQRIDALARRVIHPSAALHAKQQRLQELKSRLLLWQSTRLRTDQHLLEQLTARVASKNPALRLQKLQRQLPLTAQSLHRSMLRTIEHKQANLQQLSGHLNAVNPLAVLERGYSISATDNSLGQVITHAKQLNTGESLYVKFSQGAATCLVKQVHSDTHETK